MRHGSSRSYHHSRRSRRSPSEPGSASHCTATSASHKRLAYTAAPSRRTCSDAASPIIFCSHPSSASSSRRHRCACAACSPGSASSGTLPVPPNSCAKNSGTPIRAALPSAALPPIRSASALCGSRSKLSCQRASMVFVLMPRRDRSRALRSPAAHSVRAGRRGAGRGRAPKPGRASRGHAR